MIWLRVALVAAVLLAAWLVQRRLEGRRTVTTVDTAGLILVTADGCTLCAPALAALRREGPSVPIRVIDAAAVPDIRSVPTAIVADPDGSVRMQRSGRSVITDARQLIASLDPRVVVRAD